MKKIFLIFIILMSSNCSKYWYKPNGKVFNYAPKKGSPGFKLGWEHGCKSGLGTDFFGSIGMTFYTWSKDPIIAKEIQTPEDIEILRKRYPKELALVNWNNPDEVSKNFRDYRTVFWSAHSYCRQNALGALQNASMNPKIPGDDRFVPGEDSLGNIYKIDGRGDARWTYW